jgi:pyruvate kinase
LGTTQSAIEIQPAKKMKFTALSGSRVRHCKIVGTLGPSSSSEQVLSELIDAGLDIARLNFSHGDHESHLKNIETIRRLARSKGKQVALLQDLQGPKIRCGHLLGGQIELKKGKKYKLVFGVEQKEEQIIPIDYRDLVHDARVGHRVMMDDGLLILEVTAIENSTVEVVVLEGGLLKNRKGVNFPDSRLSLPALTEKDSRDLLFGVANRVDFIALSFVQSVRDVQQLKQMISALGADIPVIAKIEKLSAIEEIDQIAAAADGLMVARGDLGVEGGVERVPTFQRMILQAAAKQSKPVIIATQMLESMIKNPRATLAEVADVANGVLDGADCLMLSGEVASGKYPVECIKKMSSIIEEVESWTLKKARKYVTSNRESDNSAWQTHEAIARSACEAADALSARAIVCLTLTGNIARVIARWRPNTPIIAVSPRRDVIQRLSMVWGVYGIPNPMFYNTDILLAELPKMLKDMNLAKSGDVVVVTAGIPINQMCPTNMLKINRIP